MKDCAYKKRLFGKMCLPIVRFVSIEVGEGDFIAPTFVMASADFLSEGNRVLVHNSFCVHIGIGIDFFTFNINMHFPCKIVMVMRCVYKRGELIVIPIKKQIFMLNQKSIFGEPFYNADGHATVIKFVDIEFPEVFAIFNVINVRWIVMEDVNTVQFTERLLSGRGSRGVGYLRIRRLFNVSKIINNTEYCESAYAHASCDEQKLQHAGIPLVLYLHTYNDYASRQNSIAIRCLGFLIYNAPFSFIVAVSSLRFFQSDGSDITQHFSFLLYSHVKVSCLPVSVFETVRVPSELNVSLSV